MCSFANTRRRPSPTENSPHWHQHHGNTQIHTRKSIAAGAAAPAASAAPYLSISIYNAPKRREVRWQSLWCWRVSSYRWQRITTTTPLTTAAADARYSMNILLTGLGWSAPSTNIAWALPRARALTEYLHFGKRAVNQCLFERARIDATTSARIQQSCAHWTAQHIPYYLPNPRRRRHSFNLSHPPHSLRILRVFHCATRGCAYPFSRVTGTDL